MCQQIFFLKSIAKWEAIIIITEKTCSNILTHYFRIKPYVITIKKALSFKKCVIAKCNL